MSDNQIIQPESESADNNGIKTDAKGKFIEGTVGGPGRPKGSLSLTTKIKQILEDNPHQLQSLIRQILEKHPDLVWKMVDGMPKQSVGLNGNLEIGWTQKPKEE